jgi:hypothetical protein
MAKDITLPAGPAETPVEAGDSLQDLNIDRLTIVREISKKLVVV